MPARKKKKSGFLSKLLLTYLIATLIPLGCIMGILFHWKWTSGKQEMQKTMDYTSELLSIQLESIWNTMSFISLETVSNEKFINAAIGLTYSDTSSYERASHYITMESAINSYPYISSSYRVVFFNDQGYFMTNEGYNRNYDYTYRLPDGFADNYGWLQTARTNFGGEILLPISTEILPNIDTEGFSLVRSVRCPGKVVGFLAVQLTGENLSQLLEIGALYGIDIMISYDGDIIYKSDHFPSSKTSSEDIDQMETRLRQDYLVSSICQEDSHIRVTATASLDYVFAQNRFDFILTGIISLSVIALTLILIYVFARMMSSPLTRFTKKMQDTMAGNRENPSFEEDTTEGDRAPFREVQILYVEFAKMRQRMEVMMENEITLKTLQTKERLRYLQAQINPHFLYNTLNIIGIMGADVGDDRIYNSCQMLSKVLKYAITEKESTFATFEEEMKNAEMYLSLMKLRFEDKLSFSIDCDSDIKQRTTLKIILQPFVENIFEHAFDASHTTLSVFIRAYVLDDTWHIVIQDNGAGMTESALTRMKADIEEALTNASSHSSAPEASLQDNDSIGIKNTLIRMSLFYGESFHYSIDNVSSGGFQVALEGKEGGTFVLQSI